MEFRDRNNYKVRSLNNGSYIITFPTSIHRYILINIQTRSLNHFDLTCLNSSSFSLSPCLPAILLQPIFISFVHYGFQILTNLVVYSHLKLSIYLLTSRANTLDKSTREPEVYAQANDPESEIESQHYQCY